MAIRVRVKIKSITSGMDVETTALVNTGYEVEEPEVLLPRRLAEYLGIPLKTPRARMLIYETPMGLYNLLYIDSEVEIHLVDICVVAKKVNVTVAEHEREVLLSDKLSGELGIQLLDVAKGIWRHEKDKPNERRRTVKPEYW